MKSAEDRHSLFDTVEGRELYQEIEAFIREEKLEESLSRTALLGLSGGADSVFCLLFLMRYAEEHNVPKPVCVHIHHGIRAQTADRDASFSLALCETLGIECMCFRFDVPAMAREKKQGIEECARNVRYHQFREILSSRDDIGAIVTAHNATDQVETVLQRLLRGTGGQGLCGIPPKNGDIVRPLLSLSKERIVSALDKSGVSYVTDETNFDSQYTRNYIRNEILPRLQRLTNTPEVSLTRLSRNLRMDEDYFSQAVDAVMHAEEDGALSRTVLQELHPAVFARVIARMCTRYNGCHPDAVHIDAIRHRIADPSDFRISLPGGYTFLSEGDRVSIVSRAAQQSIAPSAVSIPLYTLTHLVDFDCYAYVGDDAGIYSYRNVYKIITQQTLSSVIMNGKLIVRARLDGDRIRIGGMSRRLKTLFSANGIPPSARGRVPIFADESGIVYIPGIGMREDVGAVGKPLTVFILQHI